jgi:hypothetical protein
MKSRTVALSLVTILCLSLSIPTFADQYNNGPTNGTSNAFFVDVYAVTDSFVAPRGSDFVFGFSFAEWVPAGAIPLSVDWSMGTSSFASDNGSGTGSISFNLLCTNGQPFNGGLCGGGFGYDVYNSFVGTGHIVLNPGSTYWLTLTNATDNFGGRDSWDINSGPSTAYHSQLGQVPSESFTITAESATTTTGATPEPTSIMLLGSGVLGLVGFLRKLG